MRTTLLLCVLVALSLAWVYDHQLVLTRAELAAARATIKMAEVQRVPKAELESARMAASTAVEKSAALERELTIARDQLVASQEKVRAAELPPKQPAAPVSGTATANPSPSLVKGTYTVTEDTMVYSPDAQLKVGNDILISSPSGMMLSDREVATVAGDLAVQTPSGTIQATHAFVDVNGGKMQMTADSMTFTNK